MKCFWTTFLGTSQKGVCWGSPRPRASGWHNPQSECISLAALSAPQRDRRRGTRSWSWTGAVRLRGSSVVELVSFLAWRWPHSGGRRCTAVEPAFVELMPDLVVLTAGLFVAIARVPFDRAAVCFLPTSERASLALVGGDRRRCCSCCCQVEYWRTSPPLLVLVIVATVQIRKGRRI